ncbi:unnamed protein product [Phyllotreta striolata]|uniref:Sialin n=1 Tax=Phyllotreta striolata TaxID=444603 RepID=A0A9N9TKR4_PHYSR|nr:unnamed protein product [Phyllotreta striolata]
MVLNEPDRDSNKVYTAVKTGNRHVSEFTWKFWKRKRHVVTLLTFFGFFNVYALRSNISIALVDMISLKNVTLENNTIVEKREFDWQPVQLGYVLSSFFYGYVFTQLLGGYLAARFGGAKIYGIGIAATAIFTLATPAAAKTNIYCLIAVRSLEGLFEGVNFPSSMAIWANWAPPAEKSRITSICLSGSHLGTVIAMPVSSLLCFYLGWESIFYVFGALALLWYVVWVILVRDSPSEDPRIKPEELLFINEAVNAIEPTIKPAIPWRSILTSKAVWTITALICCETWGFHTFVAFLPALMKSGLNFDLNSSGFLTALPYIAMCVAITIGGHLSDWLIRRKIMTVTNVRKTVIIVGFTGQAFCLFAAAKWLSRVLTPTFTVIGAGFLGIALSGVTVSILDIAPQFSSVILGLANTCGAMPGIVSPILSGYIVKDLTNVDQWKIIFYIAAGIYMFGAFLSVFLLTAEKQPWAKTMNTVSS